MIRLLLIGLGGFAGAILRHVLGGLVQNRTPGSFPAGTLAVNLVGCLVIGAVVELVEGRGFLGPDGRSFLIVGVLGGFTTLSAFANETVNAMRDGDVGVAALNVTATVALSLVAVYAGRALTHLVWR
ncbi:MAG TPA: fluoride efflux transporter CrcB [Gemmatimonadales bacterium]|nr:fluoride efflux transporter CrcB [Gemmatimonadales bacterium]